MNDESKPYIETPRTCRRPERIDSLLKKRMQEFFAETTAAGLSAEG